MDERRTETEVTKGLSSRTRARRETTGDPSGFLPTPSGPPTNPFIRLSPRGWPVTPEVCVDRHGRVSRLSGVLDDSGFHRVVFLFPSSRGVVGIRFRVRTLRSHRGDFSRPT